MSRQAKVVIFLLGSLGDSIVAIPALRVVRRNFPDAELVVLHESGLGLVEPPDVLPNDLVDRYISYKRRLFSLTALLLRLRRERFDAAVYLVFSDRPAASVKRDRMFFRSAGIRRLMGFTPFSPMDLYPLDASGRPADVASEAERKVARLEADGLLIDDDALQLPWLRPTEPETETAAAWLREHIDGHPLLALAPGCKTKANQWPIDNFIRLLKRVREQLNCGVIVVGGPDEAALGDMICRELDACINAAGKLNVRENAALLTQCDGYVGLDTGTTHLAAAVGISVVAIYGQRNNPGHWLPHATSLEILQNDVPCAGCRAQTCSVDGHPCMTGIEINEVAAAVARMLESSAASKTRRAAETA